MKKARRCHSVTIYLTTRELEFLDKRCAILRATRSRTVVATLKVAWMQHGFTWRAQESMSK
jgi:hypothetical protein